jgi:phage shock protein A
MSTTGKNLLARAVTMPTTQLNKEINTLLDKILDPKTPDYVRQEIKAEVATLSQIVLRRTS